MLLCAACGHNNAENANTIISIKITPHCLPNEAQRKQYTIEYLKIHHKTFKPSGDIEKDTTMIPKMIIIHHTGTNGIKEVISTFESSSINPKRAPIKYGRVNVSAHFVIDQDGTIYQLLASNRISRSAIGLNHLAIAIENVGGTNKTPLTNAQLEANKNLIITLTAQYPTITHLIGHHEYLSFENHPYFSEKIDQYRTIKIDPGDIFMEKLREKIKHKINLKGKNNRHNQ